MNSGMKTSFLLLVLVLMILSDASGVGFHPGERDALMVLRESLTSTENLHSNWTGPPCNINQSRWLGIACFNSHVVGIALEGIQLTGPLQTDALQSITYLINLSFTNNALHGPLPTLKGLDHLRIVSFAQNRLSGSIPVEFVSLPELSQLALQDNLLNGTIPPFDQQSLRAFNVSYNFLEGQIPGTSALQRFSSSSYDHNLELCGKPLDKPCPAPPPLAPPAVAPPPPPPPPPPSSPTPSPAGTKVLKLWSLILIALGAVMVPFLVILCFVCYYNKRYRDTTRKGDTSGEASAELTEKAVGALGGRGEPDRSVELEFFDRERPFFDLDDLLRSSAEVMGKGKLGTTYRATLESGSAFVVKRLKEMGGMSKKEFVQQMQLVGRMRHDNLVEIVSFYYSKDEKMVIYENVQGGSLFQLLHDNRGEGRVPLNWAARLCIVKGIARGLAYLHQSLPSHKVPHANLKTSNVLVHCSSDDPANYHSKLTDYGFLPLLPTQQQARKLAVGKVPEFSQGRKMTHKADIYCFGLVLLEVVTGQDPGESEEDLSVWVRSAVNADWSMDILDLEIVAEKEGHEEMLQVIEIALQCTAMEPERRPKMSELIKKIEQIKEPNAGEGV